MEGRPLRRTLLAVSLLLLLAGVARADVEAEIRYGFSGRAVAGAITPLRVRLRSRETDPVRVSLRARTGRRFLAGEIGTASGILEPGSEKIFTFLLRSSAAAEPAVTLDFDREVTVRSPGSEPQTDDSVDLEISGRAQAYDAVVPTGRPVVLAVGSQANLLPRHENEIAVFAIQEEDLPTVWEAYDGIETVYWRGPGETAPLDPVRVRALLRWVALGGRLIVSATGRPDLVRDTDLGEALPADLLGTIPSYDYLSVARAIRESSLTGKDSAPRIRAPLTPLAPKKGGETLLRDAEQGLAVAADLGLGRIVVLAFDPARLASAEDRLALNILRILVPAAYVEEPRPGAEDVPVYGRDDWMQPVIQLLRLDAVKPPPMGLLSFFMLLYVLAVGPLDYFVLKKYRLLKYSALTFLGLAIVFSFAAWFFSFWLFGGSQLVNRISFVDIVPGEGLDAPDRVRIHDFTGVYRPRGGTVDLAAKGETVHFSDLAQSWSLMGGMGGGLPGDPIRLDCDDPVRTDAEVSLPFRSVRMVRTVIYREQTLPLDVTVSPAGPVRVRNGLPYRLRDVAIVSRDGVTELGDLPPGQESQVNAISRGRWRPDIGKLPLLAKEWSDEAVPVAARELAAMSVLSALMPPTGYSERTRARLYRRIGLDLGDVVAEGGTLLVAWTDERDPFSLPGGEEDGFTLTVLRKVISR